MTARNEIRRHPAASLSLAAAVRGGWGGGTEALRSLAPFARRGVLLTGTASGYDAAIAGTDLFRRAGIPARAADARLILAGEIPMPDPEMLIFAVSCSDDLSDTQALCWALRNHPGLVTVSVHGSPVSEYGAVRLDLCACRDTVFPTTTYVNACAAFWFASRLLSGGTDEDIAGICDLVRAYGYIQEAFGDSGVPAVLRMREQMQPGDKVIIAFPDGVFGGEHLRRLLRLLAAREDGPGQILLCTPDAFPALDGHTLVVMPDFLPEHRETIDRADGMIRRSGARTILLTNRDLASGEGRLAVRLGCRTAESALLCQVIPVEMFCASFLDPREDFLKADAGTPGT